MLFPINVGLSDADIAKAVKFYKRAYTDIVKEINGATDFGVYNRQMVLGQIEGILAKLGANVNDFIATQIPANYKSGANQAIKQMKHLGMDVVVDQNFNLLHEQAIMNLIDDTSKAFAESINGVKRSAEVLLNKAVKEEIKYQMARGAVKGEALNTVKKYVKGVLQDQGLASLVDKGGRQWTLDRYTEMLIRTKTAEARNRGLVNRSAENGNDLVQVSSDGSPCELCAPWENQILSLTGATEGYTTLAEAEADGLFHPNCRHAINVYNEEIAQQTRSFNPDTGKYD